MPRIQHGPLLLFLMHQHENDLHLASTTDYFLEGYERSLLLASYKNFIFPFYFIAIAMTLVKRKNSGLGPPSSQV